jgi:NitT/TauT family transport system substrate-binding protein
MRARHLLAGLALVAAACGGSSNPAPAATVATVTVNVGYSEPVADNLPLYIAQDGDYFKKHHIDGNIQQVTSTQGIPALLSRQIDVDDIGGSEALSAAAEGGDVVILGTLTGVIPYSLYVAPGISSAADLKGKKVAITRPGASIDIAMHVALKKIGLDADKDVQYIQTGSVPNVITAAISGQVSAVVSKPPESLQLEAKNFKVLLNLAKEKLPASSVTIVARKTWVAANKDLAQRYIDAIVEAIAREKKDETFAVQTLAKWIKNPDDAANRASYKFFSQDIVQTYPYAKPEQLADAQATLGKSSSKVAGYDLNKLIDNSFVQSAEKRKVGG